MNKYDEYKESGIEWIGDIPSHWQIMPFKRRMTFNNGADYKDWAVDEGYPVMGSGGQFAFASKYMFNGEVVLLGRKGTIDRPLYYNGPFWAVDTMLYAVPDRRAYCKYMYYQTLTFPFNYFATATALPSMTQTDLGNNPVCVPPYYEQKAIADYLDTECRKIDDLITKEEKRAQLIEETKLSIITKVITKGLDTDKELVNSGLDWIGKMPSDWALWKTSHLFTGIGSGTTPKSSDSSYYDDEGHYWLQTGDLNDGHITDTSKKVTDKAVSEKNLRFYPVNSLVIAMYGATIGKLGILDIESSTNQACCVLPPSKKVLPMFAFYHFMAAKQDLINQSAGGGQPNISQDIIRRHKIALPPTIDEQQAIVDYISEKAIKYDAALRRTRRQIYTLREYKLSLITEVVTGKRKVCR